MPIVSNSSPLIALAAIDRLSLLPDLFEIVAIPPAVAAETRRALPVHSAWLHVENLTRELPKAVLRAALGDGEREAIALALERWDQILVDDRPARNLARELGLDVVGTVGVLLAAKRQRLLTAVKPELDKLLNASFFLSPQLVQAVLAIADESDDPA